MVLVLPYLTSSRHRLLTILSHGWQSEELSQQIHSLAEYHKDSVLVLELDCEEVSSSSQYPWKRCSNALGNVYNYPDILKVSVLIFSVTNGVYHTYTCGSQCYLSDTSFAYECLCGYWRNSFGR